MDTHLAVTETRVVAWNGACVKFSSVSHSGRKLQSPQWADGHPGVSIFAATDPRLGPRSPSNNLGPRRILRYCSALTSGLYTGAPV